MGVRKNHGALTHGALTQKKAIPATVHPIASRAIFRTILSMDMGFHNGSYSVRY